MASVRVAVVDVREVLVLVAENKMPVLGPGENLDGLRPVMRVTRVHRVRMLQELMGVSMPVVTGCDHDHTDERHRERDDCRRREAVAVDRPCQERSDERREGEDDLTASCADESGTGDPHRDR